MTNYYPVALDLRQRLCLVVGGGAVAERKVHGLLECQARIKVISPQVTRRLQELAEDGSIRLEQREYRVGDLEGAFLAMGATDDPGVNEVVFHEAEEKGILVNIADDPSHCSFVLPATVRRGDLVMAITTGGKSPALARQLRQELEEIFPPEYAQYLEDLASFRGFLRERLSDPARREDVWRELMSGGLLELLRQGKSEDAWAMVRDAPGRAEETK